MLKVEIPVVNDFNVDLLKFDQLMMESTHNGDGLLNHLYVRLNQILKQFNGVALVGFVLFLFCHCEIMI